MSAVNSPVARQFPAHAPSSAVRVLGALVILSSLLLSSGAVAAGHAPALALPATSVPRPGPGGASGAAPAPLTAAPAPAAPSHLVAPAHWFDDFRAVRDTRLAAPEARATPASIGSQVGTEQLTTGTISSGLLPTDNLAYPVAVAYDSTNATVFVAGGYSLTVGQYNTTTGALATFTQIPVTTIAAPNVPTVQITSIVFDSQLNELFVAAPAEGSVYGISATNGAIVAHFYFGLAGTPEALAVDSTGATLFVADLFNSSVDKLSASTGAFEGNASVGTEPMALAYVAATATVYSANYLSDNVSVIDAATAKATGAIAVGVGPTALAVVGSSDALWVLNSLSGNLSVLTGSSLTTVALPATSAGNATSLLSVPSDNTVYALNAPTGHLAAFNATTRTSTSGLVPGGLPFAAVYDPTARLIEVANLSSDELTEINEATGQIAHLFRLGASPVASVFSAATAEVYVIDESTYWLTELDAQTDAIIGTVALASPGYALAYASAGGLIAIVETQGAVQFFSTTSGTIVGQWSPGNGTMFAGAAYGNGEFFFTGSAAGATLAQYFDEVFVVSASGYAEIADVVAGHFDAAITYDSSTRYVDVATNGSILEISTVTDALYGSRAFFGSVDNYDWTAITWDNISNELYLSGLPSNSVAIVNLTNSSYDWSITLGTVVAPGVDSTAALYLRQTNEVYVTDATSGTTYAITRYGGASYGVASQTTAAGSAGLGYSTLSGLLYVAGSGAGTLTFLTIGPDNTESLVVTLTSAPRTVQLGAAVTLQATATYPEWFDNFSYTGLPGSCPNANVTRMVCTAGAANSFTVTVKAKNPHGFTASASTSFVVFAPLSLLAFNVTPAALTLGGSFRAQLSDSGGVAPLTVGYPSRPTGCAATASINWSCTPTAAGNFTLEAEVSDAAGHVVTSNLTVLVNPHLGATLDLSTNSTFVGHSVTFTVVLSGGTAPFTYSYTGLPAGCASSNRSSITCSPTAAAVYPVLVKVSDADGASASATNQLVVAASGSTNPSGGGLSTTDLVLIVVVVVVVAIIALAVGMRRRGPAPASMAVARPPPTPPPEEEPAPMEEEPGTTTFEAPPPEPMLPPSPPPTPIVPVTAAAPNNPSAPAAGAIEEEPQAQFYQGSNVVAQPTARGQRPALICPKCGTANEPWLTNCRKCKRALVTTGGP